MSVSKGPHPQEDWIIKDNLIPTNDNKSWQRHEEREEELNPLTPWVQTCAATVEISIDVPKAAPRTTT